MNPGQAEHVPLAATPWYSIRYTPGMVTGEWEVYLVDEGTGVDRQPRSTHPRPRRASHRPARRRRPRAGPTTVDTIHGSSIANLKELRPGTVRILFAFDPWRSSILLVAGDKAGRWQQWYTEAIPLAEQRYEIYLKERAEEEGRQP